METVFSVYIHYPNRMNLFLQIKKKLDFIEILNDVVINNLNLYGINTDISNLFENYFVFVDGYRCYNEDINIIPKKSILVCFDKKVIKIPSIINDINKKIIKNCCMCNALNNIIYVLDSQKFLEKR